MNIRGCRVMVAMLVCPAMMQAAGAGLAYSRLEDGYWQVCVASMTGADPARLTDSPSDKRCLRSVRGTGRVLFRDNEGHLFEISARPGASPKALLGSIEVVKDFDLDPDRGFLISTYAPNSTDSIRIWWYSTDEQQKRIVVSDAKLNEMPRWHQGRGFYFVRASRGETRVHRTTTDAVSSKVLFPGLELSTTDPAPSPDGRWLAYCQEGSEGMDLWIAASDGTGARELYSGPGLEAEPCWDSAGGALVFTSWDGRNFRIASIRPDGTGFTWLTSEGSDCRYPAVVSVNKS